MHRQVTHSSLDSFHSSIQLLYGVFIPHISYTFVDCRGGGLGQNQEENMCYRIWIWAMYKDLIREGLDMGHVSEPSLVWKNRWFLK